MNEMSNEQRVKELNNRIRNGCNGVDIFIGEKIIRIVLKQAVIDNLIQFDMQSIKNKK